MSSDSYTGRSNALDTAAKPLQTIDALLDACASITTKCFQYRPLTTTTTTRLEDEQEDMTPTNNAEHVMLPIRLKPIRQLQHPSQKKKPVAVMQQELLDESVRLQQEQLLLGRMYMSHSAAVARSKTQGNPDNDEAILRKHAVVARSRQVDTALRLCNELEALQLKVRTIQLQCMQQQDVNRELYADLVGEHKEKQRVSTPENHYNIKRGYDDDERTAGMEAIENGDDLTFKSDNKCDDSNTRLVSENTTIKRAIADLIVGGGLDWYSDDRLRCILESQKNDGLQLFER